MIRFLRIIPFVRRLALRYIHGELWLARVMYFNAIANKKKSSAYLAEMRRLRALEMRWGGA